VPCRKPFDEKYARDNSRRTRDHSCMLIPLKAAPWLRTPDRESSQQLPGTLLSVFLRRRLCAWPGHLAHHHWRIWIMRREVGTEFSSVPYSFARKFGTNAQRLWTNSESPRLIAKCATAGARFVRGISQ